MTTAKETPRDGQGYYSGAGSTRSPDARCCVAVPARPAVAQHATGTPLAVLAWLLGTGREREADREASS